MNRMNDDQLRAVLSRRDPAAGPPADASGNARVLWEQIMTTPVDERTSTTIRPTGPAKPRRRPMFALAAAALAAVAGVGTAITIGPSASDRPDQSVAVAPPAARQMALGMPDSSIASSCAQFDLTFLRRMPVAFQGTAVEVADTSVVLRVDHWFRGGSADTTTVRVSRPGPDSSEGVDFTTGKTYLVSAQDGTVNSCGYTGELTDDLLALFDKAF
jgi:hypothetical protein